MSEPRAARRRSALKLAGLAVGLASFLTTTYLIAESYGWTEERRFAAVIESATQGSWGRLGVGAIVVGLLVADLALPVPSSLVMTLAGRFLGTLGGFACNVLGSLAAAALGYALARRYGRGVFARLFGSEDTAQAEALFASFGPWAIALSRPVPMLTEIVSCLAGLTSMGAARFLALSLLGTAPISLAYAWLGEKAMEPLGFEWPLLIAFVLPGVGLLAVWLFGHARSQGGGQP
jgi:membrane protein DedA with SNARE-associated domain